MKFLFFTVFIVGLYGCGASTKLIKPEIGIAGDGRLNEIVTYYQKKYNLPALATVLVKNDQIIEKSAVGKRSVNSNIQVTTNDQWHIGSNTKSMTSLLAALLVKKNLIAWDTTLKEVYPELVNHMATSYKDVRLDELLSHTAGMPTNPDGIPNYNINLRVSDQRSLSLQRQEIVNKVVVVKPAYDRGTFNYSNVGYIVAGAMLERVTGSQYESLMKTYIFVPLQMTQAGFGAPPTDGVLAQPVGHEVKNNRWNPVDPFNTEGDKADNFPVFAPAGTVHASLDDMASYLGLYLKGFHGESVAGFLNKQEFETLYTPKSEKYALGWSHIGESKLFHNGSNGLWLAEMSIDVSTNTALFIVSNSEPNSQTETALKKLRAELEARIEASYSQ